MKSREALHSNHGTALLVYILIKFIKPFMKCFTFCHFQILITI